MPEAAILDLAAEDVGESTWDELVRQMVDETLPYELNMSGSCSYCSSNCICNTALTPD
jgi:hypothetical protein